MNIKGRSWSLSTCPFGELRKTWEATKYKWQTFEKKLCLQKTGLARQPFGPARPVAWIWVTAQRGSNGPDRRAARPVQTSDKPPPIFRLMTVIALTSHGVHISPVVFLYHKNVSMAIGISSLPCVEAETSVIHAICHFFERPIEYSHRLFFIVEVLFGCPISSCGNCIEKSPLVP